MSSLAKGLIQRDIYKLVKICKDKINKQTKKQKKLINREQADDCQREGGWEGRQK